MTISEKRSVSDGNVWGLFKLPFCSSANAISSSTLYPSSSAASQNMLAHPNINQVIEDSSRNFSRSNLSFSSVKKSLWPRKSCLRLDPPKKLYFPFEPGKQVRSAIKIKNTCKTHVAFKFQTTAPKSCFMRPPQAILAPGECLIAIVSKFVEHPEGDEKPTEQKSSAKFQIMSLKVKSATTDYVPELFDEQKDEVKVERILRVVFLDAESPNPSSIKALEKLRLQLAEAEAEIEARKKPLPPHDEGLRSVGEGLVIDEWRERRQRYLARRQQGEAIDSF